MKVFFGLPHSFRRPRPVVAIGVFDGVHTAHRRILAAAAARAKEIKGTSVALTFCPHPQGQKSLYSLEHRLKLIAECGIDVCVVLDFSATLAGLSPEEFLRGIVAGKLKTRCVYVGGNFRFGRGASGNVRLLRSLGRRLGFEVRVFPRVRVGGSPVSSTLIRKYILSGRLAEAASLLGRPVSVYGTVIKGDRLGTRLGFPTANIDPHHEVLPPAGIYSVKAFLDGREEIGGICYIGTRPTLGEHRPEKRVEAHLFDIKSDLYGRNVLINFISKVRNDRKFPSLEALKKQIAEDIGKARERRKMRNEVSPIFVADEAGERRRTN